MKKEDKFKDVKVKNKSNWIWGKIYLLKNKNFEVINIFVQLKSNLRKLSIKTPQLTHYYQRGM